MYICIYVCICMYVYIYMCIYMCVCIYIYICVCVCVYICIFIYLQRLQRVCVTSYVRAEV